MERIEDFIAALTRQGVNLEPEGERLRYKAPRGVLTAQSISYIRERKQDILEYLRNASGDGHSPPARQDRRELLPLSYAQEAMARAYEKMAELSTQHLCLARRLVGPLDVRKLDDALSSLVIRHPALRTRYVYDEAAQLRAEIESPWRVPLPIHDFSEWPQDAREEQVRKCIHDLRANRFDMAAGRLLRAAVARLGNDDHVLVIIIHHSIVDLWSCNVILRDLFMAHAALARGEVPRLPPLQLSYSDHVRSIRGWIDSESGREQLAYWRRLLLDVKNPFALPADDPAPARPELQPGALHLRLADATLAQLRHLAREEKTTVQVIVLAAYAVAVTQWSAADVALIAVAHFGRQAREAWDVVGCFIQSWVLRADVPTGISFRDVVRQVAERSAQAQQHIQIPFMTLKMELAERSREKPLLHITFNYRPNVPLPAARPGAGPNGLHVNPFDLGPQPDMLDEGRGEKLNLTVLEFEDYIEGMVRYSPARFHAATVSAFVARMMALLENPMLEPASCGL